MEDNSNNGQAAQSGASNMPSKTVVTASSLGALVGLGYAFHQKKQFWGYVGFFLLGSIAGSLIGNIIDKPNK